MNAFWVIAAVGLSLIGSIGSASAQRGGDGYGYRERGYGEAERGGYRARDYGDQGRDYGYRQRNDGYGEAERGGYRARDYGDRARDYGYRQRNDEYDRYGRRQYGFDESQYLRCNPDVRRAIERGQMESAAAHYKVFGRREGRRLSC